MPTTELAAPIARATFPGYAKISLEPAVLQEMFLKVTGVIALITVSVSVGISAKSDLIVAIALGPNWIDVSPIVAVLALTGVVYSLQSNSGAVLLAMAVTMAPVAFTMALFGKLQLALVMVSVGAIVYSCAVLGLWRLSAFPEGAERYELDKLPFTKLRWR